VHELAHSVHSGFQENISHMLGLLQPGTLEEKLHNHFATTVYGSCFNVRV